MLATILFHIAGIRCAQPTWYVHIRAVDVISWRQIAQLLAVGPDSLLTGPRLVSPGEENQEELVDDIEVGDVEVVLERRHIYVATNL